MVHFILGKAKSGKTSYIHKAISARAERNLFTYFLVPEQATFQNEKKLQFILPADSFNTSVISFSELTRIVFSNFGKSEKSSAGEVEKLLLMSIAAGQLTDSLNFYKKYPSNIPFLNQLVSLYDELSNSGTEPCDIASFSFKQKDDILKDKTYELSLILDLFQNLYSRNFLTDSEMYRLCAEHIKNNISFLSQYVIYIDDFVSFTYPQSIILESLICCCKDIYIAFNMEENICEAFETAMSSMKKIERFAAKENIPTEIINLSTSYISPTLKNLEICSRDLYIKGTTEASDDIHTIKAKTPCQELETAAAIIRKLTREEKVRYSDIVIFTPDFQKYSPFMESVFKRYDIPFFADELRSWEFSPLSSGVITAVKTACGIRDYDLCDLAFSPMTGIDSSSAGDFRNYCYIWSLTLSAQLKPFSNHPNGLKDSFSQEDTERLSLLNQTRETLAEPILNLKKAFKSGSASDFAKGVYQYLLECNASDNIKSLGEAMDEPEKEEFLSRQNQIWERLCDILDMFVNLSSYMVISVLQFAELLSMAVSSIEVSTIPKAVDLIDIGSPKRMRTDNPSYCFVLGACQGDFPKSQSQNMLLNDNDRRQMIEEGLFVSDLKSSDLLEKAVCYRTLTCAHKGVFISCSAMSSGGEEIVPSPVFEMCKALSANETLIPSPVFLTETVGSLKDQFAKKYKDADSDSASLRFMAQKYISENDFLKIINADKISKHSIENSQTSYSLFGSNLILSPSQIECFYSCKYKYFLKYGLKIKPTNKAELNSLETGTLIHFLLEAILKKYGKNLCKLDSFKLKNEIQDLTDMYISQRIRDCDSISVRERTNFKKISSWVFELLLFLSEELMQSAFTPAYFEMPIKRDCGITPILINNEDRTTTLVEGIVDRVDTAKIENQNYVRIVDYKSGNKTFDLGDVVNGLNMQMLIYLFSIWENGRELFEDSLPAGILYQPSIGKYVTVERNKIENSKELKQKNYKMNGLLLNKEEVLNAMEPLGNGRYIPYGKRNKDEFVFTLDEMRYIQQLVKKKISNMALSLHNGDIDAVPVRKNGAAHCDYCEYNSICSHSTVGSFNDIENIKKEDFLKQVICDGKN